MKTFRKQPSDHLDYVIDLSDWLAEGDSVVSVDVTAPDGIEVTGTTVNSPQVTVWIRGGEHGQSYRFSPLITTQSREKEVDFLMIVTEL